jgi:hypothetical protein
VFDRPLRSVFCEERFEHELEDLFPNAVAADEFVRGVEWVLVRDPRSGTQVSDSVWFVPASYYWGQSNGWLNTLVIYYTFDDRNVTLLSIQMSIVRPEN